MFVAEHALDAAWLNMHKAHTYGRHAGPVDF